MTDAIVVGAGHNGLVAACYLAKAGLDVTVVERRDMVGGAVSTVERFPGYQMDVGSSAHIMIRHTGIIEELELEEVGLEYQDLDPWGYAPFGDEAITFHVDLDATCESIAHMCGERDAVAYHGFARDWGERNRRIFEAFQAPPTAANLGRHLAGLGRAAKTGGLELSRQFLTNGDQLLDEHFEDERLKTALAWLGAQSGPPMHEAATADLVAWNMVMHQQAPGHPKGGSGMLSVALAERLRRLGGTVHLGDGAARILVRDRQVQGVETEGGNVIEAPIVVGACHVLTTFALVGDAQLPPGWSDRFRRQTRVGNGMGMVVRLACDHLPPYPAKRDGDEHRGLQLLAPSRRYLRKAHGEFNAGLPPSEPAVLAMTFSAFDDTIAPIGKHNVTIWGQWHPYELSTGENWDDIGEREATKMVDAVERAAPGFAVGIEHMHVQTPLDFERELGLLRGNVMHIDMGLDQMFAWRPSPELADYRTPVKGLYLTGASTHPGGGVFGASGRSTSRVVVGDRNRRSWLRLVPGTGS